MCSFSHALPRSCFRPPIVAFLYISVNPCRRLNAKALALHVPTGCHISNNSSNRSAMLMGSLPSNSLSSPSMYAVLPLSIAGYVVAYSSRNSRVGGSHWLRARRSSSYSTYASLPTAAIWSGWASQPRYLEITVAMAESVNASLPVRRTATFTKIGWADAVWVCRHLGKDMRGAFCEVGLGGL
jgi:hypothetical protein